MEKHIKNFLRLLACFAEVVAKMKGKMEYKKTVVVILCLGILIPYAFLLINFGQSYYQKHISSKQQAALSAAEKGTENADRYFGAAKQKMMFVINSQDVRDVLEAERKMTISERFDMKYRIINVIRAINYDMASNPVKIYTDNEKACFIPFFLKLSDEEKKSFEKMPQDVFLLKGDEENGEPVIRILKRDVAFNAGFNVVEYTIPLTEIKDFFEENDFSEIYFSNGETAFNVEKCVFEEPKKISELMQKFDCDEVGVEQLGGKVIVAYDFKEMKKVRILTGVSVAGMFLLSFSVLVLLINMMSEYLTYGVRRVLQSVRGESDTDVGGFFSKEFVEIKSFIDETKKRLEDESEEKMKYEMIALSNRMSPHFLYNTLSALTELSDNEQVKKCLSLIIFYYRGMFACDRETVSVKAEIDFIKLYIQILQLTFAEKFDFDVDISPEIGDVKIMTHMIQPLVENAVLHGANTVEYGYLSISVRLEDDMFLIEVKNSGKKADVNRINQRISNSDGALGTLKKRLDIRYGRRCRFYAKTEDDLTVLCIEIDGDEIVM